MFSVAFIQHSIQHAANKYPTKDLWHFSIAEKISLIFSGYFCLTLYIDMWLSDYIFPIVEQSVCCTFKSKPFTR